MAKARIAQIGIGGYGASIRKGLLAADNVDYVAICDVNQELAQQVSAETGAEIRDADAIFADDSIQGLAVVLPNHLHRTFVERAAAAGKHVFVEKPIANDTGDGAAMIAACREAGVQLMIGHNYRREPAYRQLKQWLDEGRLGTVIDAQCESSHAGGLRLDPNSWRFDPKLCPALPLIQLGVHLIDLCNHCFGRPVEVTGLMRHRVIPGDNVDATMTIIAYESGVLASCASHYCTPGRSELLVSGVDGRAQARRGYAELVTSSGKETPDVADGGAGRRSSQAEEMWEFAAACLGTAEIETTGEVGQMALAVCQASTLSAAEGRTVRIAELPGMAP